MTSSDDLQFPLETNFSLFSDPIETFNALTENPSLLASKNGNSEIVGSVSVSGAARKDVYPSTLKDILRTDQETLTTNSSFGPEMVPQHQSFHHQDDKSRSFNAVENFPGMVQPSGTFRNCQRETNDVHPSTLIENQHSDQETLTINSSFDTEMVPQHQSFHHQDHYFRSFNAVENFPGMMENNVQEVGKTNGPTNLNPNFQDHNIHPSLFREERYDDNLLQQKLKRIHKNDQMHRPEPSNMHLPPYASEIYSPFAQMSYQSDPYAFNFQNSSSSQTTTRQPRGRPRKNLTPMPLAPKTQTSLTSLRYYGTQDKGKQHIAAIASIHPTLYNHYRNSYTNIIPRQSGVLRQHSCNDQLENESSSSKTRRIMGTFQEKSIADSSTVSFWQNENMRSSERSIQNAIYDPLYAALGLPLDPHLRAI